MGFLEAIIEGVESLGRDKDREDEDAFRSVAARLAEKEQAWVKDEINSIMQEATSLVLSGQKTFAELKEAENKIRQRIAKFAEECFQRGARAASRMNVISE